MKFTPTTTEVYTGYPAMILTAQDYVIKSEDGYAHCVGKPDGEDSETADTFSDFESFANLQICKFAKWWIEFRTA